MPRPPTRLGAAPIRVSPSDPTSVQRALDTMHARVLDLETRGDLSGSITVHNLMFSGSTDSAIRSLSGSASSAILAVSSSLASALSSQHGYRYLGRRVFTSSQTYVPSLGSTLVHWTLIGGGGAGGNSAGGAGMACAGGGSSGGWASFDTVAPGSASLTIGGGGSSTSVNLGSVTYTVPGGNAGTVGTDADNWATPGGGAPTSFTLPTGSLSGSSPGSPGVVSNFSAGVWWSGNGGGTPYGTPGFGQVWSGNANGGGASGFGCGGGGAAAETASTSGGAGSPGAVIVEEYTGRS